MPIDYANYPKDWRVISKRIRFERAQGRCECRGECGTLHVGELSYNGYEKHDISDNRCREAQGSIADTFRGRVILTVAHTCHDPLCTNPDHLRAMCQRCHLRYDRQHHAVNAGRTRRHKRIAGGQIALLEEES